MSQRMSPTLNLDHPLQDADGFYEALLDAHAGLGTKDSAALNARLILLLANQIGSAQVLRECIALAQAAAGPAPQPAR